VSERLAEAFKEFALGRRFRHPRTGNQVLFASLPPEEQRRLFQQWMRGREQLEGIRRSPRALQKMKEQQEQMRLARADVEPVRQRSQYSCMSASMAMCLRALGVDCLEDEVNRVMGSRPMKGASWENALACGQHYGMRCTLVCPATTPQLREWTDRGVPVMIAWNPENRPWSHASVVFDVDEDLNVHVADPNIPDPDETVRVVPKSEFYRKWYEKWPDYLVRRPAMAVEREVTTDGRQVVAFDGRRVAARHGTQAREALEDYVQAVTNLETSTDLVMLATNRLRFLGLEPHEDEYPFAEPIDHVASDIFRWRGEVDAKYAPDGTVKIARRVAHRYLERK